MAAQKVPDAHTGNKQRQVQTEKGQRKMNGDLHFPGNDKLFNFSLLANVICSVEYYEKLNHISKSND